MLYLCLFTDQRNGCEGKLLSRVQEQYMSNVLKRPNSDLKVEVAANESVSQHCKSSDSQGNNWHLKK